MENCGNKKGNIKTFMLCALLGILLYAGAYFLRHLLFGLMATVPIPYIIIRVKCGKPAFWGALAALVGFACVASGALNAVILTAPLALASLVCGYVLIKRANPYYTLLYCCAAALLSFASFIILLYVLRGLTLQGMALNLINNELENMPDTTLKLLYKYMSAAMSGKQLTPDMITPQAMAKITPEIAKAGLMRIMEPLILMAMPEFCSEGVCLFGLLYAVIPIAVCRKFDCKLTALPPFCDWQLPDNFGYWAVGMYVGALLLGMAGLNNFDIVFAIISGAFSFVFMLQGLALFDWLLKKKISAAPVRVLIMALSWILTSGIGLFVWIGLLEQFAKFRKRQF